MGRIIKVGKGVEALPPAGHKRREVLKKRTDRLDKIADGLMNNTESGIYEIEPDKLKAEPEILRHLNFADLAFEVTHPVPGKVYFWCRDNPTSVAMKRVEPRMWLGNGARGWEVVGNCSCTNNKHGTSCMFPEARELIAADGRRVIGDVFLMRMDLDEYTKMHKRIMLVQRYRESNIPEPMSEWVQRNEGLVKVVKGNATPDKLYQKVAPRGRLVHGFRGTIKAGDFDEGE